MAAWWLLVVGSGLNRAVVAQQVTRCCQHCVSAAGGDSVAAGGDADDFLAHRQSAKACGRASTRSSAIIAGPAISAARPCSQTAAQAASKPSMPLARRAAIIPASTSPDPALASQAGAGGEKPRRPSGAATSLSGPLYTTTAPDCWATARPRSHLLPCS